MQIIFKGDTKDISMILVSAERYALGRNLNTSHVKVQFIFIVFICYIFFNLNTSHVKVQ